MQLIAEQNRPLFIASPRRARRPAASVETAHPLWPAARYAVIAAQ
ncbi:MAG: hypothetical protein N2652_05860 [Kiritimatiellae bacterium]|nr:hypothetical protein [Kiritimatiellia bacterium]